jgi:hypothetical protein
VNDDKVLLGIYRHAASASVVKYIREPHLVGSLGVFVRTDKLTIPTPIPDSEIFEGFLGCGRTCTGMKPLDAVRLRIERAKYSDPHKIVGDDAFEGTHLLRIEPFLLNLFEFVWVVLYASHCLQIRFALEPDSE